MQGRRVNHDPQPICTEEQLIAIMRTILDWLEIVCEAWRIDDPNYQHEIGHVMAECLMASHGYTVDTFKPNNPGFVCNLIHEYHK